ncbi:hypothetical protein LCL99_02770 [Halomonas denitrificans]|uniref:hypothetical protein n=1 Tax=Halomonas denitrificans TaxID=370769 RepID=UPI001CD5A795|nr:hypothetical protein [Halomonas denitrificans]MCA0973386.1 hypothetical protein [Halomonas denitrificans]
MGEYRLALSFEDRDRLFSAIGSVVVSFQQTELWVAETLSSLLKLDPLDDRYTVMAAMSFRQKVDLMITLFSIKDNDESKEKVDLARKALFKAEEFRNRVVHSVWAVEDDTWVREKGSIRGKSGFVKQTVCVDINQLETASNSIRTITEWRIKSLLEIEEAIFQLASCEQGT